MSSDNETAPEAPTTDVSPDSVIGKIELEGIEPVVQAGAKLVDKAGDVAAAAGELAKAVADVPVVAVSAVRSVMARYEHDIIGQAHYLWRELIELLASTTSPAE